MKNFTHTYTHTNTNTHTHTHIHTHTHAHNTNALRDADTMTIVATEKTQRDKKDTKRLSRHTQMNREKEQCDTKIKLKPESSFGVIIFYDQKNLFAVVSYISHEMKLNFSLCFASFMSVLALTANYVDSICCFTIPLPVGLGAKTNWGRLNLKVVFGQVINFQLSCS
jgi:hypothetical protein